MSGMNSGIDAGSPAIVGAFQAALVRQALVVLLVFAILGLAWLARRARSGGWAGRPAAAGGAPHPPGASGPVPAEPAGRRVLRIGFGLLWLFDGALQAQPRMAAGLPSQVIKPAAASSPRWTRDLVNWGAAAWVHHPVQAAAAAVWIEAGIGIWMLVAARGTWSRLAGLAGLGWGLAVWVFGESFGGIAAPGLSWLTGAPGAVLCYVAAGAIVALPGRAWQKPLLGRRILAGLGLFLAAMAVLQAWPGRGFWTGATGGRPGPLAGTVQSMAAVPQPKFLADWVAGFGSFAAGHGFAVNLFAVAALAVAGLAFASGRRRLIRPAVAGFTLLCLADWVLVQDLGFLGGLSTDPNSMIPFALLAVAGYLALTRMPQLRPARGPGGRSGSSSLAAGHRAGDAVSLPSGTPQARPRPHRWMVKSALRLAGVPICTW